MMPIAAEVDVTTVRAAELYRTRYTVFAVEPGLLRAGDNPIALLSDTPEHGIEILKPGPALVVRYRR